MSLSLPETAPPVSSAVGAAAYRIVQESITNVTRHAGGSHVEVRVGWDGEDLTVRVTDDGGRPPERTGPQPHHVGHGITGMRERCRLLGGRLDAGPSPGGGFEVSARLPTVGPRSVR